MSLMDRLAAASLGRRARQLGKVACHPLRHWRVLRLLQQARRAGLAAADQSTGWKYLGDYLAGGLGTRERAGLIVSHYRFLLKQLSSEALRRRWADGVLLWRRNVGDVRYAIRLDHATFCPMEGEAQLCFFRDDRRLFNLTFSVVDGDALELTPAPAMFIGGMQGGYACQQESRAAARDNGEVAPAAMLILAARAVAEALGVHNMAAVSSERQAAAGYAGEKISFRYDDCWRQLGATRTANGLFLLHPPSATQRNLDHLSASHRKRALRKAQLKAALAAEMLETACQQLLAQKTVAPPTNRPALPGALLPVRPTPSRAVQAA